MEITNSMLDPIKNNIRIYWNERSKTFDQDIGHGADEHECQLWKKHLAAIIGEKPKTILDVGTGTGMIAINFAELGHSVTGIDLCEEMLELAKGKVKTKGLSIQYLQGDAENPGFPDQMFDVVICRHLLWTLPHPDKAIREWSRMCKQGGIIIAIDGHQKPKDYFGHLNGKDNSERSDQQKLWEQTYSKEIVNHLPDRNRLTIDSLMALFIENGLSHVQTKNLEDIADYHNSLVTDPEHNRHAEVNVIWGKVR